MNAISQCLCLLLLAREDAATGWPSATGRKEDHAGARLQNSEQPLSVSIGHPVYSNLSSSQCRRRQVDRHHLYIQIQHRCLREGEKESTRERIYKREPTFRLHRIFAAYTADFQT